MTSNIQPLYSMMQLEVNKGGHLHQMCPVIPLERDLQVQVQGVLVIVLF